MVENMLDLMNTSVTTLTTTVLSLSDDIGTMADRILVQNGNTTPATERAEAYVTGSNLDIAVKAINNDTMGPISNTVMVNITQ